MKAQTEKTPYLSYHPAPDDWARQAARMPIAFSQVREDPIVDEVLVREVGPKARVFMIASGGDTAALLTASGHVGTLHLVDMNPAQLLLTRLKLHLLAEASPAIRLSCLGHTPDFAEQRQEIMRAFLEQSEQSTSVFGPPELLNTLGADHVGRYEILFHHLREKLHAFRTDLEQLLDLDDPIEQSLRSSPNTRLGRALDDAFKSVMCLENLLCLFGEEATRNAQRSFSSHFLARLRHILSTLPARDNPFLSQLLLGTFRNGIAYDWIQRPRPVVLPATVWECATATKALAALRPQSVDFVHLSNILDWLPPEDAEKTLSLAFRALRPGGLTIIRQLNSTLDIPACETRFTWQYERAAVLHQRDRSFFYRALHIGAKPRQG